MLKHLMIKSTLAALAVSLSIAAYAVAEGLPRDLPPQPLADALDSFAQLSGLQIIYRAELAQGRTSRAVKAGQEPEDALKAMLRDTGLTYTFVNDRMVAIRSDAPGETPERASSAPAGAEPQAQVQLPAKSFWNRLRVAQADTTASSQTSASEGNSDVPVEEEIVVTAARREQVLQDVPASVAVIQPEQFAAGGVNSLTGVLSYVPGSV